MAVSKERLCDALLWLALPLAVGMGAFWWPGQSGGKMGSNGAAGRAGAELRERKAAAPATGAVREHGGGAKGFEEAVAAEEKSEQDRQREGERGLKGEKRRAEILRQREAGISGELVRALMRDEGAEGLKWLLGVDSSCLFIVSRSFEREEWTVVYDYLVQEGQRSTFSGDDAMEALAAHAGGGGEALLEGAEKMPWYLFRGRDLGASPYRLPRGADPALWVESGAGRYLAEQGVEVTGLISGLAENAPQLAVEAWADWARQGRDMDWADWETRDMIRAMQESPETAEGLRQALAGSDPGTLALFQASLQRLEKAGLLPGSADTGNDGGLGQWRRELFPGEDPVGKVEASDSEDSGKGADIDIADESGGAETTTGQ